MTAIAQPADWCSRIERERAARSIDPAELREQSVAPQGASTGLPATSTPNPRSIQRGADRLRRQAELLTATLSADATVADRTTKGLPELVVDGYAHVLALDVDRLRLEREIARLAESGDPGVAEQLRELSLVLRNVTRASEELRARLDWARTCVEHAG